MPIVPFEDPTRDYLCDRLRSHGVEAHLAQRGREEERAGLGRFSGGSLGIIDIEEGPIRWVNVFKERGVQAGDPHVRIHVDLGVPDRRIRPWHRGLRVSHHQSRRVPLSGSMTGVEWRSRSELGKAVARRLEDDVAITEAIIAGHGISIQADGYLHCWLIRPPTAEAFQDQLYLLNLETIAGAVSPEAGKVFDRWSLYQAIANHLLADSDPPA